MATMTTSLNQLGGKTYKPPEPPQSPTQQTYEQRAEEMMPSKNAWRFGPEVAAASGAMKGMKANMAESFRLQDLQQGGYDRSKQLFEQNLPSMMSPTLTDNDISGLYAGMLEDIASDSARDMEALGQYTGSTGLRGGQAADLAAQVELGRLGQVTRGMRDLRQAQAEIESQDKMRQLNTILAGSQILPQVSTYGQESLANMAEVWTSLWGVERGARAATDAAKEANKGALLSGGLNLLGTAAGGFLGG